MSLQKIWKAQWILAALAMILILVGTGCEELLDEALNKNITVEEELFPSDLAMGDVETVNVAQELALGGGQGLSKSAAGLMLEVHPVQAALLAWVMSEGGGSIQGTLENRDGSPVVFGLSLSHTNNVAEAVLVGSVNLAGGESRNFSFQGNDLETFFDDHFAAGLETLYIYLSATESSTINLWISNLVAVLQPAFYMQRSIGPLADFADYIDSIGDITDLGLSGSIVNNGASPLGAAGAYQPCGRRRRLGRPFGGHLHRGGPDLQPGRVVHAF